MLTAPNSVIAAEAGIPDGLTTVTGSGYVEGELLEFNVAKAGDTYYLCDLERNIRFYDAKGIDEAKTPITDYNQCPLLTSDSPDEWPAKAVAVYVGTKMVYDYYAEVFGHRGLKGGGEPIDVIMNSNDTSFNAAAYPTFIKVSNNYSQKSVVSAVEDMGQEITHMIIANTARISSSTTGRSINEAFAISMGLLISNELNGIQPKGQWLYSNDMNFENLYLTDNAVELYGKNYDATEGVTARQTYKNAGIFMHIIYSLWEKGIHDNNELATLIFKTYMGMGKDRDENKTYEYDWNDVRARALTAAYDLSWTDRQIRWVNEAFDRAKIPGAMMGSVTASNGTKYIGPLAESADGGCYGWLKWNDGREFTGHISGTAGWPDGLGILKDSNYLLGVWEDNALNGPVILLNAGLEPVSILEYQNNEVIKTIVENPSGERSIDTIYGSYRIQIIKNQARLYKLKDGKAVSFATLFSDGYIYVGECTENIDREGYGVGYFFKSNQLELGRYIGNQLAPSGEIWGTYGEKQ